MMTRQQFRAYLHETLFKASASDKAYKDCKTLLQVISAINTFYNDATEEEKLKALDAINTIKEDIKEVLNSNLVLTE